jgi:hypothetical protein
MKWIGNYFELISKLRKIRIKIRMQFLFNSAKNQQTSLALIVAFV